MRITVYIILIILLASGSLFASPPRDKYENRIYGFSYAGSFSYSFFNVDTRHSEPASSLLGLGGMFRFHFYIRQNVHFQFGLEILSQKAKFNTYYFADGYSVYYDHSYGYTHRMRTYEMYIPLIVRIGTNVQETNAPSAFYFFGGFAPKTFLAATTVVTENSSGKDIWGGSTELTFEHWTVGEQTSTVIMAGMGWDKRFGWSTSYMTFELFYRYNFSRFRYRGNFDSNDLMIKNSSVTFQIGYRFQ